jgi:hypothetical protein
MATSCDICDSRVTTLCDRCDSISYCSVICQQEDWPTHKLLCGQYKNFLQRPEPSYKRAIFFPPNEKIPKFVWINCVTQVDDDDDDETWELPEVDDYLGPGKPRKQHLYIKRNARRNRNLDGTIHVLARDSFLSDGSILNQSVVNASNGTSGHDWRGEIIALKHRPYDETMSFYEDMTMSDFREVVDYFSIYANETLMEDIPGTSDTVKGVKITCEGDQLIFGADKYVSVNVPLDHPIFDNPLINTSYLSKMLGLAVVAWKYPPHQSWESNIGNFDNPEATYLFLETNEMSDSFGWAPPEWQTEVGSVLVVRRDLEDLMPEDVGELCYFCQFEASQVFEDSFEAEDPHKAREMVLRALTPAKYANFLEEYRSAQGFQGSDTFSSDED